MIARKSALIFANHIVGAALGLVALKLVAIYLGASIVNPVEYAIGFFGILFFMTNMGFSQAHTKRVSEGMDEGDCLATFTVFKVIATGLFFLIGTAVIAYTTTLKPGTLQDVTAGILLLVLSYYAVKSLVFIPGATFEARRESARQQLSMFAENVGRLGVTMLFAVVFGGAILARGPLAGRVSPETPVIGWWIQNPSAALAATYLVGVLFALGVGLWYMRRTVTMGRFRWDILKSYWAFALPVAIVATTTGISGNIDRAFLGFFGTGNEAALYGLARRITVFLESVPMAVHVLLFPTISGFHGRGDTTAIARVQEAASRYTSLIILPPVVFFLVFPRQVIHIFLSDEWLPAATALAVLAGYVFIFALQRPVISLLQGTGDVGVVAKVLVWTSLLNIVLNAIFIPQSLAPIGLPQVRLLGLGVTGAALATAIGTTTGYLIFRAYVRRRYGVKTGRFLPKHVLAAAAMVAALLLMGQLFAVLDPLAVDLALRWYHLLFAGVVGSFTYLAALMLLGEFTKADLDFFLDLLHPVEMLRYIKSELWSGRK